MKWLWITALLFLVTEVKSGPPTRKVGDIEEWKIESIKRTEKVNVETSEFQFTLVGTEVEGVTRNILVVNGTGSTEVPIDAIGGTEGQTPTFEWDLRQYSGQDVTIIITAQNTDHDDLAFSSADLTPFPNFPLVKDTALLKDPRTPEPNNDKLFRVEGTLGNMHLETPPLVAQGDITYYSFSKDATVVYVPCYKDDVVFVDVCDTELKHDDAPCEIEEQILVSAVLSYSSSATTATIKLTPQSASDILEAILMPNTPQGILCTDIQSQEKECTIDWMSPSTEVLDLIIIQKTSDHKTPETVTWGTNKLAIQDLELVATKLGDTILEGRWKMLPDEKTYMLTKTPSTEKETNSIEVDCSHLEDMCFGYFPHMEESPGKYTLTVAPKTEYGDLNQIQSLPVEFPAPSPHKLEILSRHTATHQNQQRADVQICFQHRTPTEGRSFSHYEMLIINEKGQWLKHSLMQEEEEGGDTSGERLCFAPFTINTTDFALTEATRVVVSQRAVDGVSVLASGESALF